MIVYGRRPMLDEKKDLKLSQYWELNNVLDFFKNERNKIDDIYPSEWFFIKDKLKEGVSILDVGCAQGGFASAFSSVLSSFNYVGLDVSEKMISEAKNKNPDQRFFCIPDGDFSCLQGEKFDLVLALGFLHLHESWRKTLSAAWQVTKEALIFDLRLTEQASIEDKEKSCLLMNFGKNGQAVPDWIKLPYNIINSSSALMDINGICAEHKAFKQYGYKHDAASSAKIPYKHIFPTTYCLEKN